MNTIVYTIVSVDGQEPCTYGVYMSEKEAQAEIDRMYKGGFFGGLEIVEDELFT